jgi:hypothetical protein
VALQVSGFDRALDYKVIHQSDVKATINVNTADGPCVLRHVAIGNDGGSADVYLKLADGHVASIGASTPLMVLRCPAGSNQVYTLPDGVIFAESLSFWATSGANPLNANDPSLVSAKNTIKVTLVVT